MSTDNAQPQTKPAKREKREHKKEKDVAKSERKKRRREEESYAVDDPLPEAQEKKKRRRREEESYAVDDPLPEAREKKKRRRRHEKDAEDKVASPRFPVSDKGQEEHQKSNGTLQQGDLEAGGSDSKLDTHSPLVQQTTSLDSKLDTHSPLVQQTTSLDSKLDTHSPFFQQITSLYLPISPCSYNFPLEGLCAEHLSPLLLTYYPPLKGVVLSYARPRMSETPYLDFDTKDNSDDRIILSRSIDEYAVTYIWLTAEFTLFRPKRGRWIEGHVSLQNESMLSLICYNYFNAVIPQKNLPKGWKWIEDGGEQEESVIRGSGDFDDGQGHFVDKKGKAISGRIVFRVEDFDAVPGGDGQGGAISILGTMKAKRS